MKLEILSSDDYSQQERLSKLISQFEEHYGRKPEVVVRVPGKITIKSTRINYNPIVQVTKFVSQTIKRTTILAK